MQRKRGRGYGDVALVPRSAEEVVNEAVVCTARAKRCGATHSCF
jgi:hypothetical protein